MIRGVAGRVVLMEKSVILNHYGFSSESKRMVWQAMSANCLSESCYGILTTGNNKHTAQ